MNQFQKQIYVTPILFATLLLCILAHWLLEPVVEWLDMNDFGIYIYMAADVVIITLLLLPRIRLVINIDGFRKGNNTDETPSFIQIMASLMLLASLILLPFAAVNWINKIGKTANIYTVNQLKQKPAARYVALSPKVLAQLRLRPAQPVNYMNSRGTYRYTYYTVFVPSDSTVNCAWLPCISYSQDSFANKMEQTWHDTFNAVFTAQHTQYFRSIGANANKNKYYSKSLNSPRHRPAYFEKTTGDANQENAQNIMYLTLLLADSFLFYGILTWILPVNWSYANLLSQGKVQWWNPFRDSKVAPYRK